MAKLTKYQQQILDRLRKGEKLYWGIGGVYYKHRRLMAATEEALLNSRELACIKIRGRLGIPMNYLVHTTQIGKISAEMSKQGKTILSIHHKH